MRGHPGTMRGLDWVRDKQELPRIVDNVRGFGFKVNKVEEEG
jgi:hypothetical protein